ncbi:GNAT family N-acetyltransferase [Krasilnikovia sp. M28-CT-15]|uniref:GNAT family N-acetyltransferase n=1 Tax=Krasilnikovia sp. M28-CT-15 TaxID=3373540 RepID=UPI003875CFEB
MRGKFVELRPPTDTDDYALIASWVRPLSAAAVLAGDNEVLSAEEIQQINRTGTVRHLMVVTHSGDPIGVVSWRPHGAPGGYSIGSAVGDQQRWAEGYGGEASALLVDYLFHICNAHRIQVVTALFNKHSMRMVARAAFVLEGILRDHYFLDGEYHDAAIWSMLRDEYYAEVRRAAAIHPEFGAPDLVPAADKAEARRTLTEYLAQGGPTSLARFPVSDGTTVAS